MKRMAEGEQVKTLAGKWVVIIIMAVSLVLAIVRFIYIPKTNPREADPGNPFYSPPPREQR